MIQSRSSGALLRGFPHSVVAGISQFSNHLAEISVPWQLVPIEACAIGRHTVSHCFFILYLFLISINLVSMQQKFHGKLIVFGSAVFDDIGNHIASVVFEYVNIFLCVLLGFFFSYLQMIFFYICWVWAQSLISLCFIGFFRVTES